MTTVVVKNQLKLLYFYSIIQFILVFKIYGGLYYKLIMR